MKMEVEEGKSLVETPTWAVASVVSVMVLVGFFINAALRHTEKWLYRTKRKALIAALDKIKEELMLFAVLSLLMGHWIIYAAKICVKSSAISSRFYPCSVEKSYIDPLHHQIPFHTYSNSSVSRQLLGHKNSEICPELCFSRQIWSSINRADYRALRLGFITHPSLDFRHFMHFSWFSWYIHLLLAVVPTNNLIKLAVETKNTSQSQSQRSEIQQINLRDELFWFGRPRLLLRLIQFISFQMGSRFKKTIVSENVRESLHTWRRRVKAKHQHDSTFTLLPTTSSTMSLDSMVDDDQDEIVPFSSPHAITEETSGRVLEVSTPDEKGRFVPIA
ncbi:Mlo-related protein [Cynara cardunculus var. scolymus]|uniref:Mlo-related protein n=1 Tax=Cynara cardunculus var. scolymus TaxID=59895 RepID=A0A103Y5H3_CYNCS|nr:Mlo-related protein [Cynara cardunculus var. scolymus]